MIDFNGVSLNEQLSMAQTSTDPEVLTHLGVH